MPQSVSRRRLLGLGVAALAGCLSDPRERTGPTEDPGDESTPEPDTTADGTPTPGCGQLIAPQFNVRDTNPSVPPCPDKPAALGPCTARRFALGLEKHRRYARAIESPEGASEVAFGVTPQTSVRETETGFIVFARLNFRVIRTADGGESTPTGETRPDTATTTGTPTATATPTGTRPGTSPGTGTRTATTTPGGTATSTESDPTGLYNVHYLVTPEGQWRAVRFEQFDTAGALRQAGSFVEC